MLEGKINGIENSQGEGEGKKLKYKLYFFKILKPFKKKIQNSRLKKVKNESSTFRRKLRQLINVMKLQHFKLIKVADEK